MARDVLDDLGVGQRAGTARGLRLDGRWLHELLSSPVAGTRTPGRGPGGSGMYRSGSGFPSILPGRRIGPQGSALRLDVRALPLTMRLQREYRGHRQPKGTSMRNPIRGETDAFYIAFGSALLIGASAAVGALVDPLVGVALFIGGVIGALMWEISHEATRSAAARCARPLTRARPRRPADARARHREQNARLPRRCAHELRGRGAPARSCTSSRRSCPRARTTSPPTSTASLPMRASGSTTRSTWSRGEGLEATGRVGDPNAALGAIEDELRGLRRRRGDHLDAPRRQLQLAGDGHRRAAARGARHPGHAPDRRAGPRRRGLTRDRYCATAPSADQAGMTPDLAQQARDVPVALVARGCGPRATS